VVRTKPAGCSVTPPTNAHCRAGRPLTSTWPVIASNAEPPTGIERMGTVKQRSRLFEGQPDGGRRSCQRRTGDACQLHRLHLAQPSWPPANCPFHRRLPTSRSPPNSLLVRQVFTAFVPPALGKPMWRSSIRHMPGRYRSGIDQRPRCRPAAHARSIDRALSSGGTRAPATTRSGARSISLRAAHEQELPGPQMIHWVKLIARKDPKRVANGNWPARRAIVRTA
jgi:hypothetical protein